MRLVNVRRELGRLVGGRDLEKDLAASEASRQNAIRQRDEAETARWDAVRQREAAEAARWDAVRQREELDATVQALALRTAIIDPAGRPSIEMVIAQTEDFNVRMAKADAREANRMINDEGLSIYLALLLHPDLPHLPSVRRRLLLSSQIREPVMASGNHNALVLAHAFALLLERVLRLEAPDLFEAIHLYDSIYGLCWVAARSLLDMAPFDRLAVRPFSAFLAGKFAPTTGRPRPPGPRRRVCYCCHYVHRARGNAVQPIMIDLIRAHLRERGDLDEVFVYAVQFHDPAYVDEIRALGATIRVFSTWQDLAEVERLRAQFDVDQIDVAITEIASGVMSYVYASRAAPLQFWLEMGYPYWSVVGLDWVFLGHKVHQPHFGIKPQAWSLIRYQHDITAVLTPASPFVIDEIRAHYPAGARLIGTFARLTKITLDFMRIVEEILRRRDDAVMLIAGAGDPTLILDVCDRSRFRSRIFVIEDYVEIGEHGPILDVFLDTFPFCGGNAIREVQSLGVPVVSMLTDDWPDLVKQERDHELIAENVDDYVGRVLRLLADPEYHEARRVRAREIACHKYGTHENFAVIADIIDQLSPGRKGDTHGVGVAPFAADRLEVAEMRPRCCVVP